MTLTYDHIREVLADSDVSDAETLTGNYPLQREALSCWFSSQRGRWNAHSVILGSLAVFGWMPTILEGRTPKEHCISLEKAERIAQLLNDDKVDDIPYDFVNRSSVGTSKFLHFWRRDQFPIWDINVSAALFKDDRRREKPADYQRYRRAMLQLAAHKCCKEQARILLKNEQTLFWLGKSLMPRIRSTKSAKKTQR